jgi:outer membrane lipoprotein carrier protein
MLRSLVILPLLLLIAPAWADQEGPRAMLDRFADGLESLTGSFSQVTLEAGGRLIDESEGQLYYLAPDRFRWSYETPFPQELVADGEKLWHFDESLDQVTVRDQPPAAESPLLVLTQPDLLDRFYRIEASEEAHVLRFRPLAEDGEFEQASLTFIDGQPAALELIDAFGQLTRLELFELVRNAEVDPAMFNFVVPDGVDVLEGY